jgi:hypothetical protein
MIQKDIIARLVSAGLNRGQAEIALLIADGAKISDLKKTFGVRAVQHARFLKDNIGPRSQIKALVDSCWQLMQLEKAEEKRREENHHGFRGKSDQGKIEKEHPGKDAGDDAGETKSLEEEVAL